MACADQEVTLIPDARIGFDGQEELRALEQSDPERFAGYRPFADVETYLEDLAATHPSIVSLEIYGKSDHGRPLYALKLSDSVAIDEAEPEIMITAATHGDELITVEVVLHLLDELVTGYGADARLTAMVDTHELYFVPVVSPDGFVNWSRHVNGLDPNREYPWPQNPDRQPLDCIQEMMDFSDQHKFAGSMDFHSFGEMVMYPWAYKWSGVAAADQQMFVDLTEAMAKDNNYAFGQIPNLIGTIAAGSSADYHYWKNGTVALGIEIAQQMVPPSSQINAIVDDAREMTWTFIENF
jgi:carboxypeptidase T